MVFDPPSGFKNDYAIRVGATFGGQGVSVRARGGVAANISEKMITLYRDLTKKSTLAAPFREWALPQPIEVGQHYEIELRNIGQTVAVKVNGELIGTATDDGSKEMPFVIALDGKSEGSKVLVTSLHVLDLNPTAADPQKLAATATLPESGWQPIFTDSEWRTSDGASRVFHDGWLHLTGRAITKPRAPAGEGLIRTKVRLGPGITSPAIILRDGTTEWRLELVLNSLGKPVELRVTKGTAGSAAPPKTEVVDAREFSFRAFKDFAIIELSLTGKALSATATGPGGAGARFRASDEQLAQVSEWGIGAADGWFESVEMQPLGAAAAAVSPSPAPQVSKSLTTPSTVTKDAPFINTLGMKFVPVPISGGPTKGQRVLFGVWDVRVEDYAAYSKANPQADGGWRTQSKDGVPAGREADHPVVGVNWEDAQAFCQWLTAKETAEGKLPPGMKYRLPSDEEWSWAAGMPPESGTTPAEKSRKTGMDFPWGKDWPPEKRVGNYADETFHAKFPPKRNEQDGKMENELWMKDYTDGFATSSPVGSFPANVHGLYDMGGNVRQWCEDWFDEAQKERVLRGSTWGHNDRSVLLSSYRDHSAPERRYHVSGGFRCVLASATSSPPASATAQTAPFTNTLGMKFVPVPITGGPTDKLRVLFSIWETRVQDYAAFATETKREWLKVNFEQGPTHPAVNVSWEDATAFCTWLTEKERKAGRIGTEERYRLPSDHEWSCGVGIGDLEDASKQPSDNSGKIKDLFPWGTQWPPPQGAGNYAGEESQSNPAATKSPRANGAIAGYTDGFVYTSAVESFAANRFGLHDMGGNVRQWCEDWFDKDQRDRVVRGGSWSHFERGFIMSSARGRFDPGHRIFDYGFRCVLASSAPIR